MFKSKLSIDCLGYITQYDLLLVFIVCEKLHNPSNGSVNITGYITGDTATYQCDFGYELIGDSILTCQLYGWSESPPICEG